MDILKIAAAILFLMAAAATAQAQVGDKKALNLEGAKKVIAAAVAEAKSKNAPGGAIAVVDDGGNLIAVERLDNTFAAGANISIGKARTAALFRRPIQQGTARARSGRSRGSVGGKVISCQLIPSGGELAQF